MNTLYDLIAKQMTDAGAEHNVEIVGWDAGDRNGELWGFVAAKPVAALDIDGLTVEAQGQRATIRVGGAMAVELVADSGTFPLSWNDLTAMSKSLTVI